jgi:Skp family chaperone for outer membrane proteins
MAADVWMYLTPLAAIAGAVVGAAYAAGRSRAAASQQLEAANRQMAEGVARAREQIAESQQRAQAELAAARAEWQSRLDAAVAAQRAEADKLKLHLTDAFDELERLRHASRTPGQGPDTGQGFPATMPLQDL